jgi:catechol 2,3-dioxygenase-like lactoylglutathione lyase family enzyme
MPVTQFTPFPNRFGEYSGTVSQRCLCVSKSYYNQPGLELYLHDDVQDTECDAWKQLCDLIERATKEGHEEFSPRLDLGEEGWKQIITLPPTIAKLKKVKKLRLYGSNLVRIPPEIGGMESLEIFEPYTSYRLHWFPYEITRCKYLNDSTVSTRAIYGNFDYRMPFPRLPHALPSLVPQTCSVCDEPLGDREPIQRWISLWVGTDVMPLLVHACSEDCLQNLPIPHKSACPVSHIGGQEVKHPLIESSMYENRSYLTLDHIQLAIPAGEEDAARAFFISVLGMTEDEKPEPLRARGGVWFRLGNAENTIIIHCGVETPFAPQKKAHPAFRVQDLDLLVARLEGAGYPILWDETLPDRRRFFTEDPFGNRMEFLDKDSGFGMST